MSNVRSILIDCLTDRYTANAARIRELAAPLTNAQFWSKPFPFGNSFGHLVLHLTVPSPREFHDPNPPSKDEALKNFDDVLQMVLGTIRAQSPEDLSSEYSAVGSDSKTRLDIVIVCAAHMQHHIGQMIYLGYEIARTS